MITRRRQGEKRCDLCCGAQGQWDAQDDKWSCRRCDEELIAQLAYEAVYGRKDATTAMLPRRREPNHSPVDAWYAENGVLEAASADDSARTAEESQTRRSRSSQGLLGNTATLGGMMAAERGSRNAIDAQVGARSVSASRTTTGNHVPPGSDEPPRTGFMARRGVRKVLASNAWLALWLFVAGFCAFMGVRANYRAPFSDARAAVTRTNTTSTTRHQPEYRTREIQDLRKGDTVLTMDPETGKVQKHRIIDAFSRTSDHLRILEVLGVGGTSQTLETTDEHPFWSVSARDFVPAGELATGDQFVGPAGELQTLTATCREEHPEGVTVYNFEVEDAHTYFVMAHGSRAPPVLVHNATGGVCPVPSGAPRRVGTTFGHGARHLQGTGLSQSAVESAITRQIQSQAAQGAKFGGGFGGRVTLGGRTIEYRAFTLPDGTINIGTFYPL